MASAQPVPCFIASILKEKLHPKTREDWMAEYGVDDFPVPSVDLVRERLGNYLRKALESVDGDNQDWVIDHDAWSRVMLDCVPTDGFPEYVKNRHDAENLVIEYWDCKKLRCCSGHEGG